MNTHDFTMSRSRFRGVALVASLSLGLLASACVEEPLEEADELFRAEGDGAIEDPEPAPLPPEDEGSEQNAGVEGPMTIDSAGVGQLLAVGGVGPKLQAQAQLDYTSPAIVEQPGAKIEALTGEPILDAGLVDGDLVGVTPSYRFRVSTSGDQFLIRHRSRRFSDVPASAVVPESAILQQATADLALLGVNLGAGQSLSVDRLMRAASTNPQQPEAVAYKVFVKLELNGRPVSGPKLVLSYYLDGELHKLSAHWPEIHSGPPAPPSSAAIQSQVFAALSTHPLGAESNPLTADAYLVVVGGQLRHVVAIEGLLDNGLGDGRYGELAVLLP